MISAAVAASVLIALVLAGLFRIYGAEQRARGYGDGYQAARHQFFTRTLGTEEGDSK